MTERTIGRYEIRSELGRGGMGTVYLAYDPVLEREVALKLLPSYLAQDPDFSSRFAREAKTVAGLDHQAIVAVYDFGEEDVWPYFVMRYMRGGSLKDRLADGPVTLAEANKIVQRIAGALDKAHSRGVVHRDLKPANILYDAEGQPYLGDFGIVRLAETSESFTRTGNTLGTPAYMSPEQADALPDIDGRSDVYSLGVVLYEMLAGEPPYQHDSLPRLLMMHLTAPIPNLLEARPDLPSGLQDVINMAMAKDREERFQTAGELAATLLANVDQPASPSTQQATSPTELPPSRVTPPVAEEATEVMPGPPAAPLLEPVPAAYTMEEEPADSNAGRKRILALITVAVIGLIGIAIIVAVVAVNSGSSTSDGEELADNGSSLPALQRIREHGHIHVGIRESDLFPFTFGNSDEPNGFEIDLVLDLVQRVFGDEVSIEFQPLSVGSGFAALKSGEIDMMVRMTPKTTSRVADPDLLFSNNYFLDGQRLLVPRGSGIAGWGELDGRRVCVLAGTTDGQTLDEFRANVNINLEPIRLANSEDIFNALLQGQCDAYSANWSILENDIANFSNVSGQFQIVDGLLTREPIAIVFGNDIEFASLADQMLFESIADGTWQALYSPRFSDAPPWTVEEMLSEPPADR